VGCSARCRADGAGALASLKGWPPFARFDSFARGGRSFEFNGCVGEIRADHLVDVVPALEEVELRVGEGLHAAGFIAYEAAPALDPALSSRPPRSRLPLVWFALFREREDPRDRPTQAGASELELSEWEPALRYADYAPRIASIHEWIAAGDTYQVNLTFPVRSRFKGSDTDLYLRLGAAQRAEYCALLRMGHHSIVSASPELFFRWSDDQIEMRPMKGTRPRGRWSAEDSAMAEELATSEKDRAENLMVVDLLRNDVGRVAEFGSVRVPRLFDIERYPTVLQMTSSVTAVTRPGTRLTDVLRAVFPSGSVTGAPKVRTSRIIADLEPEPRGVYTGAIGFVSPGEAVFSVPIRTAVIDRSADTIELGIGSGITYDSDPRAEYEECMQKAAFTALTIPRFELLETMRYEPGVGIRRLDEHLARMAASAYYFDRPFSMAGARGELERLIDGADPRRIRLLLAENGGVEVRTSPIPPLPSPIRAALSRRPVDGSDRMLFHKTTHRVIYESPRAEHREADDVLLVNERGELTEFTIGNLVLRMDGTDWTPPLHCGLLPGIMRATMLARHEIRERVLVEQDLAAADEVYLINSLRGRVPVVMI
jgi:para-aminobenzoate synthetase/4-amino-4-deoxychorismate lyase